MTAPATLDLKALAEKLEDDLIQAQEESMSYITSIKLIVAVLEQVARQVRDAKREANAKMCEAIENKKLDLDLPESAEGARECAAAIRTGGEKI